MNVFAKSSASFSLTPGERALLKLFEALIAAGLVAAIPVVLPLLSAQHIDWSQVLRTAAATFSFAVLAALGKYLTAQKDPPLGIAATPIVQSAIQAVMADIQKWYGAAPVVNAAPGTAAHDGANDGANDGAADPAVAAEAPAAAPMPAPTSATASGPTISSASAPAAKVASAGAPATAPDAVPVAMPALALANSAEADGQSCIGEPTFDVVPTVAATGTTNGATDDGTHETIPPDIASPAPEA